MEIQGTSTLDSLVKFTVIVSVLIYGKFHKDIGENIQPIRTFLK